MLENYNNPASEHGTSPKYNSNIRFPVTFRGVQQQNWAENIVPQRNLNSFKTHQKHRELKKMFNKDRGIDSYNKI